MNIWMNESIIKMLTSHEPFRVDRVLELSNMELIAEQSLMQHLLIGYHVLRFGQRHGLNHFSNFSIFIIIVRFSDLIRLIHFSII